MDERDWAIIKALMCDGRRSLTALARMLGVSHTAIAKRLSRLPVRVCALLSRKLYPRAILLELEVDGGSAASFERALRRCPRLLLLARMSHGRYMAVAVAEDDSVLESMREKCGLYLHPAVRSSSITPLDTIVYPDYLPLDLRSYRELEKPPCGLVDCRTCSRYREGKCPGCPAVRAYRGDL